MAALGWIVFWFGYIIAISIVRGAVLVLLWDWFIVPKFGLPHLGIIDALGISMLVGLLTYQYDARALRDTDKSTKEVYFEGSTTALFLYGFTVLFALVLHALQS